MHLECSYQVVQLGVGFFVWNVTGDPVLYPGEHFVCRVYTYDRSSLNPQQNMEVWSTSSLVLQLVVVVGHFTQHLPFDQDRLKECMEL